MKKTILCITALILFPLSLFGQGRPYDGPTDAAGDISMERNGQMTGNRLLFYFENTTMLGSKTAEDGRSRWPNNYKGTALVDGMAFWVGAEVYITEDSIPVVDPAEVARLDALGALDTLFFIETSYRRLMDENKSGTVEWGFYPVQGYFNETQDYPAMSNKPNSWPAAWPAKGLSNKWPGEWNGRFGRGVQYADLEVYFVVNDAQDMEYIVDRNTDDVLRTDEPKYYPKPDVKIGDLNPSVTIQKGLPWGGLGLRIEVRGYQWNNPEARDMIFWEYNFANISDYNLLKVGSGYWFDAGLGNDGGDDVGHFNEQLNLAYTWDIDGIGEGGLRPGTIGYAYLESPAIPYDGNDNDDDGLIDEKRDNPAGSIIGPYDGIDDLQKFLDFYHLDEEDLKAHYEGDEDQDWVDGYDANGNGTYSFLDENGIWQLEEGEYPGDDIGLDGVGPLDLNYNGPDEGECNHKPDFEMGVGAEPNFAWTDISESDMIGLTDYHIFSHDEYYAWNLFFEEDRFFWEYNTQHTLESFYGEPEALNQTFSTSPFPLYKGQTERISMAMLMSYDGLNGLNSGEHSAPNLFRQKETAQIIYERDYRFAQPPELPTLYAVPGDGQILLYWDNAADTKTREPFLRNENDFEGYKLYKATDKKLSDPEVITDTYGNIIGRQPIFQCDLINHIEGIADFGAVNGLLFNFGEDTGIKHHFIDTDVQNGKTYYYALVAYDRGIPDIGAGISPTENNIVIELDESEEIIRLGRNVQVVTPRKQAAGYLPPSPLLDNSNYVVGNGDISINIVDNDAIQIDHQYVLTFMVDTLDYFFKPRNYTHPYETLYANTGFSIYDMTNNNELIYQEKPDLFPVDNLVYDWDNENWMINPSEKITTDIFDGIQLTIDMQVRNSGEAKIDSSKTGWVTGNAPLKIHILEEEVQYFPWEYEIIFTGEEYVNSSKITTRTNIYNHLHEKLGSSEILTDQSFNFYGITRSFGDSGSSLDTLDFIVWDTNENSMFDPDSDYILVGWPVQDSKDVTKYRWGATAFALDFHECAISDIMPKMGDVYKVNFKRPFVETDSLFFSIESSSGSDRALLNEEMENIKVVPNPYIATNTMEPSVMNHFLNQRRRLMFTHIPADCVIRIFTTSGILVDKIDVNNEPDNGIVHWDLLTRENLEIAAGMYIYHVKSNVTGKEKLGKFAVIK